MSAAPDRALSTVVREDAGLPLHSVDLLAASALWLDGLLEAVCVVDGQSLLVIDANPSACQLLGQSREVLRGLPVTQLLTSPEDAVFWLEVQHGTCEPLHSDTLVACAGGDYRRIERRVHRLALADGRCVFVLGMLDRSAQHAAEERLEKLLSELRATIESTADGILVTDLHGAIQGFNRRFSQMWNVPEALLVQRDDVAIYQWMRSQVENDLQYGSRLDAIADAPLLEGHDTVTLKDGRVLERVTLPQYGRGLPIGRVFSFRDITDRLAAQARLHLAATVFESSLDPIFITDADYGLMAVNQACQNLLGQSAQALVGRQLDALFFDPSGQLVLAEVLARLPVTGRWDGELSCLGAQGVPVPVRVSLVYETESGSGVQAVGLRNTHCIGVAHDLSERHADRQRIRDLAYTDSLTGLPNRMLLAERMDHAIAVARREEQTLAVLFIDLDRFKHINDSLGHQYGDRVLVEVAQRIKHCLRVVDTVARQGGDEFVAILHNCDVQIGRAHV